MRAWANRLAIFMLILMMALMLATSHFVAEPTQFQAYVLRTVLAVIAGAFASLLSGFLQLESKSLIMTTSRIGGGIAVFVLIYLFNPLALV